jgi:aspartyl/asparaginyl beta-hydroxylase (cupin superfamily)
MAIATDSRAGIQQGAEALRRGDAAGAREVFRRVTAAAPNEPAAWLGLAMASRTLKDADTMLAALDRVIALDPTAWQAFLMKADHFAALGEARSASSFYAAAMKRAPQANAQMPKALQDELARARAMNERYQHEYEDHIRARVAAAGAASPRFRQSIDMMLGKKQVYVQQPLFYYFPELPQIQFYEREAFPWLGALEAATADVRGELIEVLKDEGAFAPYLERDPSRPQVDPHGMIGNPSWSAFYLIRNGSVVAENAARCPKTLALVDQFPLARAPGRTPSVLFSLLKPGAHIPPHHGFVNTRLICHLGLVVPPNNVFRVGNDVREWEEGKAWVFDDTMEHEAWNRSDRTRVILLFDVWRPELTEEERRAVSAMFEAIDAYSGKPGEWNF